MLIANLDKVENNNKTDVITFAFAFDLVFIGFLRFYVFLPFLPPGSGSRRSSVTRNHAGPDSGKSPAKKYEVRIIENYTAPAYATSRASSTACSYIFIILQVDITMAGSGASCPSSSCLSSCGTCCPAEESGWMWGRQQFFLLYTKHSSLHFKLSSISNYFAGSIKFGLAGKLPVGTGGSCLVHYSRT